MGQAIKTLFSDSMNLVVKDIKSIGIIMDLDRKKQAKKELVVLKYLRNEIESRLELLESSYDVWEDLKRFVDFIFWLENFQNEYRSKITDEDKIKRTFYVDTINRFFFHCMAHLHQFDSKLRTELSAKELSRERAVYLSIFLKEEIAKQELCEYFRSFGKDHQLEVSSIGDLIEETTDTKHWPQLKLGKDSRIVNFFKKEEIQHVKNELSFRIAPQLNVSNIDYTSILNLDINLNSVNSIHSYNQKNISNNVNKTIHHNINNNTFNYQCKNEKIDLEKLKPESKKTKTKKAKSLDPIPQIKWNQLEKFFLEFFNLPILDGEKIPSNDIHDMINELQKSKNQKLPPDSITKFFRSVFNRKLFRLYLRVITDPTYQTSLIPYKKQSEFMKRWDIYFGHKNLKTYTLNDFIGAKASRKDKVETLKHHSNRYFEIKQKLNNLKNNEKNYNSISFRETRIFIDKILELAK